MNRIEIFRSGTHTDAHGRAFAFSDDAVAAIAAGYDPALSEAPLVIGHPKVHEPAFGWVKGLRAENGALVADADQIEPQFAELVRAGRFKKISASFFTPDHPSNPTPGRYYLRHVGFLGAQAPAVKGLKPVELAEDDGNVVTVELADLSGAWRDTLTARIFRSLRDFMIGQFGQEAADKALPPHDLDFLAEESVAARTAADKSPRFSDPADPNPKPDDPASREATPGKEDDVETKEKQADLEKQAAELNEREKALKKQQAEFAEVRAKARGDENVALIDQLVGKGRMAPGLKPDLLAFMDALDAETTVDFSEGAKKSPLAFFRELLNSAKPVIDFGERAAEDGNEPEDGPDAETLAARASEFVEDQRSKGKTVSYSAAVAHVKKQKGKN